VANGCREAWQQQELGWIEVSEGVHETNGCSDTVGRVEENPGPVRRETYALGGVIGEGKPTLERVR